MTDERIIIETILEHHSDAQAVYLFGSRANGEERPDSDIDVAVLLLPDVAKTLDALELHKTQTALGVRLRRPVDLVNLRRASTVLQKEVVMTGQRIHTADVYAAEEFEMLMLSFYQKLNEERAEVLSEGIRSGRFYTV